MIKLYRYIQSHIENEIQSTMNLSSVRDISSESMVDMTRYDFKSDFDNFHSDVEIQQGF